MTILLQSQSAAHPPTAQPPGAGWTTTPSPWCSSPTPLPPGPSPCASAGRDRDVSLHRGNPRPSLMLVFSAHLVHGCRSGAASWLEVSATPRGWPCSASSDHILPHPELPESYRDSPTFPTPLCSSPLPWSLFLEETFKEGKQSLPTTSDHTSMFSLPCVLMAQGKSPSRKVS